VAYVVSGFAVGLLVGMTGVGGGSLMTPLLILVFGFQPTTAVGTDLLFAASTKSAGTIVHGFSRSISWRIVAQLAAGSMPATAISLGILSLYPLAGQETQDIVRPVLGIALLLTATGLILRKWLILHLGSRCSRLSSMQRNSITILTGTLLGVLVSFSSVGAGALGVTALILLHPDQPAARIVGSDIAHAVPLTFLAGLGHWLMGSVDLSILSFLLLGSVPGVILGSLCPSRVPDHILRSIMAITLLTVGGRLLVGA